MADARPDGVELISVSASQGSCDAAHCMLGTIQNGDSATIELRVRPATEGELTNTAEVASSTHDPAPEDNTVTTITTVDPAADLGLTAQAAEVDAGDELVHLIEVTNAVRASPSRSPSLIRLRMATGSAAPIHRREAVSTRAPC